MDRSPEGPPPLPPPPGTNLELPHAVLPGVTHAVFGGSSLESRPGLRSGERPKIKTTDVLTWLHAQVAYADKFRAQAMAYRQAERRAHDAVAEASALRLLVEAAANEVRALTSQLSGMEAVVSGLRAELAAAKEEAARAQNDKTMKVWREAGS